MNRGVICSVHRASRLGGCFGDSSAIELFEVVSVV